MKVEWGNRRGRKHRWERKADEEEEWMGKAGSSTAKREENAIMGLLLGKPYDQVMV